MQRTQKLTDDDRGDTGKGAGFSQGRPLKPGALLGVANVLAKT